MTAIQSLWIGPRLSALERLSIASFLAHGHEFHLYTYGDIEGVPEGARVISAEEILPRKRIFRYRRGGSFAGFSNLFRYKMLLDQGGWWSDLDTICLRPLDFTAEYAFSSEIDKGETVLGTAVLKAPAGSELFGYLFRTADAADPKKIYFGETGPRLLHKAIEQFQLQRFVLPPTAFCAINWPQWEQALRPGEANIPESSYGVHLWNEMWRRDNRDKDAAYPPDCLYEQLKSRYGVAPLPQTLRSGFHRLYERASTSRIASMLRRIGGG